MEELKEKYTREWNEWKKFPDPRKGEYLYAPFGCGVYQLKNTRTCEFVLFGKSKYVAKRMTSLLPSPLGVGTRNNEAKRDYVLENIEDIVYRTIAFDNDEYAKDFEDYIKSLRIHIFNT